MFCGILPSASIEYGRLPHHTLEAINLSQKSEFQHRITTNRAVSTSHARAEYTNGASGLDPSQPWRLVRKVNQSVFAGSADSGGFKHLPIAALTSRSDR